MPHFLKLVFVFLISIPSHAVGQAYSSKRDNKNRQQVERFFDSMQKAFESGVGSEVAKHFSPDQPESAEFAHYESSASCNPRRLPKGKLGMMPTTLRPSASPKQSSLT